MTTMTGSLRVQEIECPPEVAQLIGTSRLFTIGNTSLLSRPAIGICGSRRASPSGLRCASDFGREAAQQGAVVVSGYAKGVDREAHKGAVEAGGSTIAVIPEGILYFRVVRELKPLLNDGNFLAISMFPPDAPWKAWRAMERNKLIVALSAALFVVEAGGKGGTINAAEESDRQGKPVYAVEFKDNIPGREGNVKLIRRSAKPVKTLRELRAALHKVLSAEHEEKPRQFTLDELETNERNEAEPSERW